MARHSDLLDFKVNRSKLVQLYLHAVHLLIALLLTLALPIFPFVLLPLGATAVCWWLTLCYVRISMPPCNLQWRTDGAWLIRDEGAQPIPMRLRGCFVHHRLTILRFMSGRFQTRTYLILDDNCDPELARRLRCRLLQEANRERAADSYRESLS